MSLTTLINDIARDWPEYRKSKIVDKNHPVYQLVCNEFVNELDGINAGLENIKIKGSTGQATITAAPWIAIFNTLVTDSASRGYYLVYLFSIDLNRIYLSLGLGANQFKELFTNIEKRHNSLHQAAARMRGIFDNKLSVYLKNKISERPLKLNATKNERHHIDYEQGSIYSIQYDINNLPNEITLLEDYKEMVSLYNSTAVDPITPDPISLFTSVVDLNNIKQRKGKIEYFTPRKPKMTKLDRSSSSTSSNTRRYSEQSKKVGDAAEKFVLQMEKTKLINLGLHHLAEKIVHEEAIGSRPGWDITSYDSEGNEIYIEVKATTGKILNSIELTVNEWQAAQSEERKERYFIYLVTNAFSSKPDIEILQNPSRFVDSGSLQIKAIRYELIFFANS